MSRLFTDTHPKIEALQIELLRDLPHWRKLEMVWQMNAAVQTLLLTGLQARHPDEPPEKLRRRMADLLLGDVMAIRVYGPMEDLPDAG